MTYEVFKTDTHGWCIEAVYADESRVVIGRRFSTRKEASTTASLLAGFRGNVLIRK